MSSEWLDSYDNEVAVPPAEREQAEREVLPVKESSSNERLEKAQELREANEIISADQKWADRPAWAENEEARKVNPMTCEEFIGKLRRAGIYVEANNFSVAGRLGINGFSRGVYRTITTLQFPASYEYSVMRFNEYNVPTNEKYRGWRTALIHLIEAGILTAAKADEIFGPATGPVSQYYLAAVRGL